MRIYSAANDDPAGPVVDMVAEWADRLDGVVGHPAALKSLLVEMAKAFEVENKSLREALQFYADCRHLKISDLGVSVEDGALARKVL